MSARPNVIVFFTDQQRWDAAGVHGNPLDLMPHFDRVAARGTHVANAFTCAPVCGPARACLQTGAYATTNGAVHNGVPLTPDLPHLADCFNNAGYRTGYIGKWHLAGAGQPYGPVAPELRGGYQDWLAANVLEFTSDSYNCVLYDNDGDEVKLPGYRVDAMTDAAIRYVDAHQHEPFFLFLSYIEPHFQNRLDDYPPPVGYRERYTAHNWVPPDLAALGGTTHQHLPGYWGMIKRLDEAFGRLLDALKSLGLDDNTVVLFTSDHGCHFRTRNAEYKRSCHDSSIRVPTALCGPGFDGGGRVELPVSLVDYPPTLLDACGLDIPSTMQGLPLLRRREVDWPSEMFVQVVDDPKHIGRAVRTARWKYGVTTDEDGAHKRGGADAYRESHLYDLECDPYELCNLVELASHEKVCGVMRDRLVRRMKAIGEKEPTILPAPRRPSNRHVTDKESHA